MNTRPRYYDREIKTSFWMTISIILIVSTLGTILVYSLAELPISKPVVDHSLIYGFSNNAIFYRNYLLAAPVGMAAFGWIINQFVNRLRNQTPLFGRDKTFGYPARSIGLFIVFGVAIPMAAIIFCRTEYYAIGRADILYRTGVSDTPHRVGWRDVTSVEKYCRLVSQYKSIHTQAQLIIRFRNGAYLKTKDEYGWRPLSDTSKNYVEVQRIAHTLAIPYIQVSKSSECRDEPKI
jgi:hypothetical protein